MDIGIKSSTGDMELPHTTINPVSCDSSLYRFFSAVVVPACARSSAEADYTSSTLADAGLASTESLETRPLLHEFGSFLIDPPNDQGADTSLRENHLAALVTKSNFSQEMIDGRGRDRNEWSSSHSEKSSLSTGGDGSSTRDCSTTEADFIMKKESKLRGCRGVLCLGASKVASLQRAVQRRKAEEEHTLEITSSSTTDCVDTPSLGAHLQKTRLSVEKSTEHNFILETPSGNAATPTETNFHVGRRQPRRAPGVREASTRTSPLSAVGVSSGFAGPRFKTSPSPLSVPIPIFDSSD